MKIILYEDKAYTREEIVAIFGEEYIKQVESQAAEPENEYCWSTQRETGSGKMDEFACELYVYMRYNFEYIDIKDIENVEDYPWDKAIEGYFIGIAGSSPMIADLESLAELINDSDEFPWNAVRNTIECNRWIDTSERSASDICSDGERKLIIDESSGKAVVLQDDYLSELHRRALSIRDVD